jgi:preprotein translocase subunit YajC
MAYADPAPTNKAPEVVAPGGNAPPVVAPAGNNPSGNGAANAASNAATGNAANSPVNAGKPPQPDLFSSPMIWGLFALIILMFWWSSRGKKKQEQKHRDMLSSLKKGDKITTIGGIIGTVIEVRDDEVVVKVDETNNVRMRFIRGAIRDVGQAKGDAQDQKK